MMRRRRVVCRPLEIRRSVICRIDSSVNWHWSIWTPPIRKRVSWTACWRHSKLDLRSAVGTSDGKNEHNDQLEQNGEHNLIVVDPEAE